MIQFHSAQSRGAFQNNWLNTRYSFSFSNWYNPERMGVGPLRVLNDDIIAPKGGFPMHSHENMEIITIVLSGSIAHKDSMGNDKSIQSGEIQIMSAGTGVMHSEFNPSDSEELHLFQAWIAPNKQNIKPRYDQKSFQPLWSTEGIHTLVTPYTETYISSSDTLYIYQNASISIGTLKENQHYNHTSDHSTFYLMCIEGKIEYNNYQLQKRDALIIQNEEFDTIQALTDSRILLFEL